MDQLPLPTFVHTCTAPCRFSENVRMLPPVPSLLTNVFPLTPLATSLTVLSNELLTPSTVLLNEPVTPLTVLLNEPATRSTVWLTEPVTLFTDEIGAADAAPAPVIAIAAIPTPRTVPATAFFMDSPFWGSWSWADPCSKSLRVTSEGRQALRPETRRAFSWGCVVMVDEAGSPWVPVAALLRS